MLQQELQEGKHEVLTTPGAGDAGIGPAACGVPHFWGLKARQQVFYAYPGVIALGFQLRDLLFPLQELLPARAELPRQRCKLLQKSGHGGEQGERDGDGASVPAPLPAPPDRGFPIQTPPVRNGDAKGNIEKWVEKHSQAGR